MRQVIEEPKTNHRLCGCTVLLPIEKRIGRALERGLDIQKRLCVRLLEVIKTTCENCADRKAQNQSCERSESLTEATCTRTRVRFENGASGRGFTKTIGNRKKEIVREAVLGDTT